MKGRSGSELYSITGLSLSYVNLKVAVLDLVHK